MIKVAAGQYTPACEIQARKTQMKNILEKAAIEQNKFHEWFSKGASLKDILELAKIRDSSYGQLSFT